MQHFEISCLNKAIFGIKKTAKLFNLKEFKWLIKAWFKRVCLKGKLG